jgi:hypothetical protein
MEEISDDTPIEELPGILGYQWDDYDFISLSEATGSISADFVRQFDRATSNLDSPIEVELTLETVTVSLRINFSDRFVSLLADLPSIYVQVDCPPDQGPASGAGLLVFLRDGYTVAQAKADVEAFMKKMKIVLAEMEASD